MKRLWILLVVLMAFDVSAMDIKPTLSGSWFNPDQNGHGFSVEVMDDGRSVIYWYVYDHNRQPIFLLAIGENNESRIEAEVYYQDGMKFGEFDGDDLNQVRWGSLIMDFQDCDHAVLSYDSDMMHSGQVFGSGTIQLQRLAAIGGSACVENRLNANYMVALTDQGEVAAGQLLIFFDNFGVFFTTSDVEGAAGWGEFVRTGNRFTFTGDAYYMSGAGRRTITLQGEITRDGIIGTGPGLHIVASRMDASLATRVFSAEIVGSWDVESPQNGYEGTVQITEEGAVSGNLANGCTLSGNLFKPSPKLNQIWFSGETTGCNEATPVYAGGTYDSDERNFTFFGANNFAGFVWFVNR